MEEDDRRQRGHGQAGDQHVLQVASLDAAAGARVALDLAGVTGGLAGDDPSSHPQVQAKRGPVIGLQPEELAAPVGGAQLVTGQGSRDLTRLVGA